MLDYQEQFYSDKVKLIVGVDEAGRGPLAGPVVAAACILPRAYINKEINDSKQLSEKKREELFEIIKKDAIAYGVGIVSAEVIDEINIYEATKKAMTEAINNLTLSKDFFLFFAFFNSSASAVKVVGYPIIIDGLKNDIAVIKVETL